MLPVRLAGAQATTTAEATKAVEDANAAKVKELGAALNADAQAAAQAAQKASKAATAAAEAAEQATKTSNDAAAKLEDLQKVGKATAATATTAAQEADSAAAAASKAADGVTADAPKAVAGIATGKAASAARKAATARDAATKAAATLAEAKAADEAKKQLTTIAAETAKAALAASDAAAATLDVVAEAVRPRLPVTSEQDDEVFEALRARITGGAIFFNGAASVVPNEAGTAGVVRSDQFSQAATYLAFETQPRVWSFDWGFCRDAECRDARDKKVRARGYNRFYVDPFANVRLTTIPVTGAKNTLTTVEAPSGTFLQSQKAVQLQLGAMSGFNFNFPLMPEKFHWGFGPVYRFMFQNVTDSQRTLRPWDIDNDLFKLQSAGLRLTLFQKDQHVGDSPRRGWAPAAYLDVSRGRFENFETATGNTDAARACLLDVPACLVKPGGIPAESEYDKQNKLRWYMEGRIFLQYLYFGFDLNTGSGPDDLRFISGLSVKLDSFFTRRN